MKAPLRSPRSIRDPRVRMAERCGARRERWRVPRHCAPRSGCRMRATGCRWRNWRSSSAPTTPSPPVPSGPASGRVTSHSQRCSHFRLPHRMPCDTASSPRWTARAASFRTRVRAARGRSPPTAWCGRSPRGSCTPGPATRRGSGSRTTSSGGPPTQTATPCETRAPASFAVNHRSSTGASRATRAGCSPRTSRSRRTSAPTPCTSAPTGCSPGCRARSASLTRAGTPSRTACATACRGHSGSRAPAGTRSTAMAARA